MGSGPGRGNGPIQAVKLRLRWRRRDTGRRNEQASPEQPPLEAPAERHPESPTVPHESGGVPTPYDHLAEETDETPVYDRTPDSRERMSERTRRDAGHRRSPYPEGPGPAAHGPRASGQSAYSERAPGSRAYSPRAPSQRASGPPATPSGLPEPPSVGRVSRAWQRHLGSYEWPRTSLVADCGRIGPVYLSAASAVGRTHAHRSQQRQDAYGFKALESGLVCAIADGVSEAQLGAPAADTAVAAAFAATESLAPHLFYEPNPVDVLTGLERLVVAAREAVEELAWKVLPDAPDAGRQCASTLLLAAVRALEDDGLEVSIVSVGDSSALELTREGAVEVIVGPRSGDRQGEQLRDYLPKREARVVGRECRIARGSTLLLATDGLALDLRESATVREWVAARLREATTPLEAGHALSYARQRSGDDLTFVAVRPVPSGEHG